MFTVNSILVPIDFSENSIKALSMAKEIARGTGATLHLLHVVEPVVYPADWSYAQVGFADIELELQNNAETELGKQAAALEADGYTKTEWGKTLLSYPVDYNTYVLSGFKEGEPPIYLVPMASETLTTSGFTNGYGFNQK